MMSTPSRGADQRLAVERIAGDGGGALEFGRHLAVAGDGADVEAGVDEGLANHAAEPTLAPRIAILVICLLRVCVCMANMMPPLANGN